MAENQLVKDLIDDSCINILIGNTKINFSHEELQNMESIIEYIDYEEFISEISMPHLSTKSIERLYSKNSISLPSTGHMSRKDLFSNLILKIENINKFLSFLFSYQSFKSDTDNSINNLEHQLRQNFCPDIEKFSQKFHYEMVEKIINYLNSMLSDSYLDINTDNSDLRISLIPSKDLYIESENITKVNNDQIRNVYTQALDDIKNRRYESALTKARTLLEEIFIYLIDKNQDNISDPKLIDDIKKNRNKGEINKLYSIVKRIYKFDNMNKKNNDSIKGIISTSSAIIHGIAELRNSHSDAHGRGQNISKLDRNLTLLVVNMSVTISEYLLSLDKDEDNNVYF